MVRSASLERYGNPLGLEAGNQGDYQAIIKMRRLMEGNLVTRRLRSMEKRGRTIGLELWTTWMGIIFDNIIVTTELPSANTFARHG